MSNEKLNARSWMLDAGHLSVITALILVPLTTAGQTTPPPAQIPKPGANAAAGVIFTEVTKPAGLSGFRFVAGTPAKDYIIDAPGAGCAFIDYDNDGWLDVYLINGSTFDALRGKTKAPRSALFRNKRDGTFIEVTDKAGVENERWGQGVCAGDFDNDGWQDLYVTNFGKNRLYRNNRNGTFTDIAEKAGVTVGGWSAGCAFGDYNGDGKPDLFAAGYIDFDIDNPPPAASDEAIARRDDGGAKRPNDEEKNAGGMGAAYTAGANYCQYRGRRVMCGPRGLKGAPDHLFKNNGDGTFTDVSELAGVADKARY
jgi:hypothetical protein